MKDIMDEDKRLEEELKELRQVPIDENDRKKKKSRRSRKKTAKRRGFPFAAVFMALVVGVLAGLGGGYYVWGWERPYTVDLKAVEVPDWVKQEFIRKIFFKAGCEPQEDQQYCASLCGKSRFQCRGQPKLF